MMTDVEIMRWAGAVMRKINEETTRIVGDIVAAEEGSARRAEMELWRSELDQLYLAVLSAYVAWDVKGAEPDELLSQLLHWERFRTGIAL